jgi:hypothetical protein
MMPANEFVLSRRGAMAKKTSCPISRAEFRAKAKPITVTINQVPLQAEVKEFSTGSLGWYLNAKTTIEVGGTVVPVQIGMNLTVVGSKDLPPDGVDGPAGPRSSD